MIQEVCDPPKKQHTQIFIKYTHIYINWALQIWPFQLLLAIHILWCLSGLYTNFAIVELWTISC